MPSKNAQNDDVNFDIDTNNIDWKLKKPLETGTEVNGVLSYYADAVKNNTSAEGKK